MYEEHNKLIHRPPSFNHSQNEELPGNLCWKQKVFLIFIYISCTKHFSQLCIQKCPSIFLWRPLFLSDFTKTTVYLTHLSKNPPASRFMKIHLTVLELRIKVS